MAVSAQDDKSSAVFQRILDTTLQVIQVIEDLSSKMGTFLSRIRSGQMVPLLGSPYMRAETQKTTNSMAQANERARTHSSHVSHLLFVLTLKKSTPSLRVSAYPRAEQGVKSTMLCIFSNTRQRTWLVYKVYLLLCQNGSLTAVEPLFDTIKHNDLPSSQDSIGRVQVKTQAGRDDV